MIQINKLPPFKRMCVTIGNLPTSFMESMSYYEALEWLYKYLSDTIIPTVNNTGEAVTELQNAFTLLETYVNTYFDNLDVQEEINNKLDAMAESGELTDIIAQYLGLAGVIAFDNVAEMKVAENIVNGSKCRTLGFYSVNDGGGAYYKIRNITNDDVVNEASIIALADENLIAELIFDTELNIKQIGAYGDGTHDDHNVLLKAFEILYNKQVSATLYTNTLSLVFPYGVYYNASQVYYSENYLDRIIINAHNSIITGTGFRFGSKPAHNIIINNLCFKEIDTCLRFDAQNREYQSITLNDCVFTNCDNALYIDRQSVMVKLNNCQFRGCGKSMYLLNCDQVVLDNCWFEQRNETVSDRSCFIEQAGNSEGCIIAKNCFFIPKWNGTELAWFKISHMFEAENCRFSGETPNKSSIVYTSSQIESVTSSGHRTLINIHDCPLISAPDMIIVEGLPDTIRFINNSGNELGHKIIKWSSQVSAADQLTKLTSKITKFQIFLSGNNMRPFDRRWGYINLPSDYRPTVPVNMCSFIHNPLNQNGNITYTIDSYDGTWPSFTSIAIHFRNIHADYKNLIGNGFLVSYRVNDSGVLNYKTVISFISLNQDNTDNLWKFTLQNIVGNRTEDLVIKVNGTEDSVDWTSVGTDFTLNISKASGKSVSQFEIIPFSLPNMVEARQ